MKILLITQNHNKTIDITSSTYMLTKEALIRGYEVYFSNSLFLQDGKVTSNVSQIDTNMNTSSLKKDIIVNEFIDIVLLRLDPPFNNQFLTITYLLDMLDDNILIINNPSGVRNLSEKILATHFPKLMLPTMITDNINIAQKFLHTHNKIVVKELYDGAGRDIHMLDISKYNNFDDALIQLNNLMQDNKYMMLQKFSEDIYSGDRRILLLNGEIIGAMNRVPQSGNFLANMAQGGSIEKIELQDIDYKIVSEISNKLVKNGLIFAGLDVIGSYITEINTTAPTGIYQINNLYNINLESQCWNEFEKLLHTKKNKVQL